MLVWVTGVPGAGKSAVCAILKGQGLRAVDADWEGLNCWVSRATGVRVVDRPHPLPPRWRDDYAWHIDTDMVRALAVELSDGLGFVAGTVENEADAWDLFDHVVCLVVDEQTLRYRLATRTTNAFGKDPVELEMALAANREATGRYRHYGATIIDATQPVKAVVRDLLAAVVK
ncbi:MAG: AAA family ATPase [Actinomycetota bacterium]|nr:AAA family ATPase [Actinomycetota bacterium]